MKSKGVMLLTVVIVLLFLMIPWDSVKSPDMEYPMTEEMNNNQK